MFRFKKLPNKDVVHDRVIHVVGSTNYRTSLLVKYTSSNYHYRIVEFLSGTFNFQINVSPNFDFKISFFVNNPLMKNNLTISVSLKEQDKNSSIIKESINNFLIGKNFDELQWITIEF